MRRAAFCLWQSESTITVFLVPRSPVLGGERGTVELDYVHEFAAGNV